MKPSFYFVLFLLLISSTQLFAQVSDETQRAESFNNAVFGLGFSGGPASGVGVSFRSHLPSKSSIQLIAGIVKTKDNLFYSFGAEYQYDLVRGSTTRFYFGPAIGYFYSGTEENTFEAPLRFGLGLGGEFKILDALHGSPEVMFVYFSDATIVPWPQLSLHYYFF